MQKFQEGATVVFTISIVKERDSIITPFTPLI
jgi:hypothetical protein